MQVPKIPSIFKSSKNKEFDFVTRYYNEKEERKQKKEKQYTRIRFQKRQSSSLKKKNISTLIFLAILTITILLIFKL